METIKTKKIIAFDMDGTLSESRLKIDREMSELIKVLLKNKKVAIITGGAFADIEKQILSELDITDELKAKLILLPTNGGSLWRFERQWTELSVNKLTQEQKHKIISALKEVIDDTDEVCEIIDTDCVGNKIQDRDAQITYSARGDGAELETKIKWDPDFTKRTILQRELQKKLADFEVKIGGKTSIDITPKGMDKAYGMRKLISHEKTPKEEILFLGDAIYEGGNDFPVSSMGIDFIKVDGPEHTKQVISSINNNVV